jgi:general secretion pathway protein K
VPPKKAWFIPESERGFILIIVLLIISLLLPVVLAFYSRTQINLLQAGNFRDTIQAARIARSGVEEAIALIANDDASYDSLKDKWAQPFPPVIVNGEPVDVEVADEERKININLLVGPTDGGDATGGKKTTKAKPLAERGIAGGSDTTQTGTASGAAQRVNEDVDTHLRRLITRLGGQEEIVDALIDWMDVDDNLTGSGGAEAAYYGELGYHPKNGPLDTLDELLMVKGWDKDLLNAKGLYNFITIAPTEGKININTAPMEVLHSFSDILGESEAQSVVDHRESEPFISMGDVERAVKIDPTTQAKLVAAFTTQSSFFSVKAKGTVGKVTKTVQATLKRDQGVSIFSWREF